MSNEFDGGNEGGKRGRIKAGVPRIRAALRGAYGPWKLREMCRKMAYFYVNVWGVAQWQ